MNGGRAAWLRRGGAVLAAALVIAAALAVLVALRSGAGEEKQSREFAPGASSVSLELTSGDVEVRAANDDQVRLTRVVRGSPEFSERLDGDVVRIRASCPSFTFGRCDIDYQLEVPRGVELDAETESGDVRVAGIDDVEVKASSGDVEVEDVAKVGRVETESGGIEVSRAAAALTLSADSGDVKASGLSSSQVTATASSGNVGLTFTRAPTNVVATTKSGDATIRAPGSSSYAVDAKASSGDVKVDVPRDDSAANRITVRTGSGDATVVPG